MLTTSVGRVHVLDVRGRGRLPPVVLLHGLSAAGVHYVPLLFRLIKHVSRVVLPDLPGHGFSPRANSTDARTLQVALTEALDQTLDEPAWLFGNSLGGYSAIRYALQRPERVRGLLLASPAGAQMEPEELASVRSLFRLTRHGDALRFIDRLFAKPRRFRHLYALGLRRQFRRTDIEAIFDAATTETLISADELRALTMPLLLIWGQAERILPARSLAFFRAHLPSHVEIHEPYGWGHAPFLDDVVGLARRLLNFMHVAEMGQGTAPSSARHL